jgi:hypothetical protein
MTDTNILVGNILPKSVQISLIERVSVNNTFYNRIISTDKKIKYSKEVDPYNFIDLLMKCFYHKMLSKDKLDTRLVFSNIGPFSYNNLAFFKGLLKGLNREYTLIDWKKVCLHIRDDLGIKNRIPEPMTKETIDSYIDNNLMLKSENVEYLNFDINRSRYADAIAFYYLRNYLCQT